MVSFFALSLAVTLTGAVRTLVMPLDDLSPDQAHSWVGEGFAEALTSHLLCAGQDVIGFAERDQQLQEKGFAPGTSVSRATVIVIGRELGATRAVVGSYRVVEGQIQVTAKVIDLTRGAIVGVVEDHAALEDLLDLESQLAKNILRLESDDVPACFERTAERRRSLSLTAHEKNARARAAQDLKERRTLLESALQIASDYSEARLLLGRVLFDIGEPLESIQALIRIQPDDPVYREAYFLLGLAYLAADQPRSAVEIFSNLSEQEEKAAFSNDLGVALLRSGDLDRAVSAFHETVGRDPEAARYLFNLAWANWRSGKGSEALRWLREVVRKDPADAEAHFLLAAAAASQALPEESEEHRKIAVALSPEVSDLDPPTAQGLERLAEELPPTSESAAEVAERAREESTRAMLDRARADGSSGRIEEAVRELQRLLYLDPHALEARIELAGIYARSGEPQKAIGEYLVVLWAEDSSSTRLRLAETYLALGNVEEARVHAEKALQLDPGSSEASQLLERLKQPQP